MSFTGTRIRVAPRVLANQYANKRADLYQQQKFFEGILTGLQKKDTSVLSAALQVPSHLNDIRKAGKDAAKDWMGLSQIAQNPKAHYQAALQRAVQQLSRRGDPDRLEAYKALLSGKATDDLSKMLSDIEKIGANIVKKAKDLHEQRKDNQRKSPVGVIAGLFDTNGDGRIDDAEIADAVGRLRDYLARQEEDYDEEDDDDDEDFGDDADEDDDDDAEAGEDDDQDDEVELVGRGGGGGGHGGGHGGHGGGHRGHGGRGRWGGGYWGGPSVVTYGSDWDLPVDDIIEDEGGTVVRTIRPRFVRRILV